jgi:hypothetical protein
MSWVSFRIGQKMTSFNTTIKNNDLHVLLSADLVLLSVKIL